MVATENYTWQQGDDLEVSLVYLTGPAEAETPQNLTGYAVRMDIVAQSGEKVYTFNSQEIADVDPTTPEAEPDTNIEAVLGTTGEITFTVPRLLTLPGGAVYNLLAGGTALLNYDIFLRNTQDKQHKILKGQITVEPSYTLWV